MNCNADELARTRGLPPELDDANDRIVRVKKAFFLNGEPAWELEERVNFVVAGNCRCGDTRFKTGDHAFFDRLQDKYLRPIRGLEGPDETMEWIQDTAFKAKETCNTRDGE